MANNSEYRRTLEYMAKMNLTDQQRRPQQPPPPVASKNQPLPPPPPPYSSKNVINNSTNNQENSKPKLPYNVKLPKVDGPSEAEKKLELLTRELEKEMDEREKQEYFGKFV